MLRAYHSDDRYRRPDPAALSASASGALLGVSVQATEVIELELAAGYYRRRFADSVGSDSGLTVRGSLNWWPTRLLTVRAELLRDAASTRIPGAVGKIRTDGTIEVADQYTRRANLFARGRMIVDQFDTIGRTDRTYVGGVGANRLLGSHLVLSAEYDYASRHSATAAFVRHVISLSLRREY
jgi:hypothetical protein